MTPAVPEEALPDESRQRTLLVYALLTGLTALIPVPFADDLAKGHLRRRLVHLLARAHGRELSGDTVQALAREPSRGGCLGGCLAQALLYPLKKVFRKVFFFLEWKRAVDLTSYTYHWGHLVDYAFQEGLVAVEPPGTSPNSGPSARADNRRVDDLRTAIERACQEAPIKPVERAVSVTLRQSRAVLLSAATRIRTNLTRGAAERAGKHDEPASAARATEPAAHKEEEAVSEVSGVAARLQQRIASAVPEAHFRDLRERFRTHLQGQP